MDLELKGKVALVLAASKGLGRAAAEALAREGANVAIASRSALIEQTAAEIIAATGVEVLPLRGDVTRAKDIERITAATIAAWGRIDILVINAGGPPPGNFLDFKPDDWEAAIQLTLMSAVRVCYAVLPHMLARQSGSIVAIESISVKQPIDNLILSNSIRMAVIGLLKSLANEFGGQGVRVNSINPTYTYTDRVADLLHARAEKEGVALDELSANLGRNMPLGRVGTTEEFGKAVAWLASPAASYIHGHALMFDGGATRSPL